MSDNFAATPSGYFISIILVIALPAFGYAFKKLIDKLSAQDATMRVVQIEQTKQSEALTLILSTTNPANRETLATTLARIQDQITNHIATSDRERSSLSLQISDMRQSHLDQPERKAA